MLMMLQDQHGLPCLHMASQEGNSEVVEYHVAKGGRELMIFQD